MKRINETQIGNLAPNTFRPTEAESLILLNIDDMSSQGRNVTQQDAINVPEEKLKEKEISPDALESAFAQLVKLRMLEIKPDQTIVISQSGQPVIEELKKAEQQAELTAGDNTKTDTGELPQNPMGDQSTIQGQSPPQMGMESFNMSLIKELDGYAKLWEDLDNLQAPKQAEFTVYRATANNVEDSDENTYYGYCAGTGEEAIKNSFYENHEGEEGRGIVRLIKANGGPEGISFETEIVLDNAVDALRKRNDLRRDDPSSIVGPSNYPGDIYKLAKAKYAHVDAQRAKEKEEKRQRMMYQNKIDRKFGTANKYYNKQDLHQLRLDHGDVPVTLDAYRMKPSDFAHKYGLPFPKPEQPPEL